MILRIPLGAFILFLSLISCKKEQFDNCDLSSLYGHLPFHAGVAVDVYKLQTNERYRTIVTDQFNSVTPENAFKFDHVQPSPGEYNWQSADYLVEYAKKNNKRIHGHTLLWFRADPQWATDYTHEEADRLMRTHIDSLVGRYRTSVFSWDVINEAIDDDGKLRETIWSRHFGEGYIHKAFEYARVSNPDALLFYNDYNLESNPGKLDAVLTLLKKLKQQGVRIDGIGMQLHISYTYPNICNIAQAAGRIMQEGFIVHFSEMDISMNPKNSKQSFSSKDLQKQAQVYRDIFRMYGNLDPAKRFGITLWGVSDKDSWIPAQYNRKDIPLLFDQTYEPKPAYCACKASMK